jgi:phosphoglycerate dehydrogenase-like enzyme
MTSSDARSVLVPSFLLEEHRENLERAAAGRAKLVTDEDLRLADRVPDDLEVIVTGVDERVFERAISAPTVRWVHSISAGVEHLPLALLAERGIALTNTAGAYATAMAEYAIASMIMLARNLPAWLEGQRDRRWLDGDAFGASVLRGKQLGIVGYGAVGREIATIAKALGMGVWATKRTPVFISGEPVDRLLPAGSLHELLSSSDVVVLCASLNRSTRALLGEEELGAMKPASLLVNVARGGLIDEDALVRALTDGRIRGAMLDVTTEEPLPSNSPLWTTPNLLITPHISGNAPESWEDGVEFFCANLGLYLDGTPERMGNLVEYSAVR